MRPLRLDLQGFTAFRQYTSLELGDLELFALVGPTGSGKSSLLDAMTFALYGQTARLGASGLDALISQGERGLNVSLTFEVGGGTYRASRTKGRKQAENELRLEKQDQEGRWLSLSDGGSKVINERIRQVVGLDFRTFVRSVMLPQGQFAQLLHGSGKDRQALLGELTGLDHVQRMQQVAADRTKELKHQSSSLNSVLLNEYAQVSAETLSELRRKREEVDAEAERLSDERERLQGLVQRLRDQEKVFKAKQEATQRLHLLQARAQSVLAGAERAARARKVAGVLPLLDAAERARIAHEREQREEQQLQVRLEQVQQALQRAEQQHLQAQADEQQLPALEARILALRDAEADAARLKRMGGHPDLQHPQPLPWDEDTFHTAQKAAERVEKNLLERKSLETERVALKSGQERFQQEVLLQEREQAEQGRLEREGKAAKTELEEAQKALAEAQLQAGLDAHRHHLKSGEPCPLCAQEVHELPAAPRVDLSAQQQRVQVLTKLLDDQRGRFSELRAQLKARAQWLRDKEQELNDWASGLEQRAQDLKASEALVQGDPLSDVQRLLASLAARVREAGPKPAQARQQAQQTVQDIRQRLQQSHTALSQVQGDLAAAQASAQAANTATQQRQDDWQQAQTQLQAQLSLLNLNALEAQQAGLPEPEIGALEEAARSHSAQVAQQQAALHDLERQLGLEAFDPAQLSQASRDLTATDAALKLTREQAGALAEQERLLRERLARKAEIEAQASSAARQLDTWQTLTNTLKVNEFQQFLLAEVEAQLLGRAGLLLHEISDGRYRLALHDSDYVVQDLWNAGELRGVKTLSGGETFLASLALAIALSDYLAGNKILGALFLDEGFGTLDPQALEAVAGALENLRTQGRMVGIVTHVESLSERLPCRLLVSKSVAGSTVQRVEG